ncbi:hypothetical protein [Hydrogenophaga sp.]|uniref:hypothetical protein n=1 Tax=Hydrogenophaga sp. TaxID=1904254 RepID=UPI002725A1F1|nr:hypothetical protein [Hydrogenophaga sp.]MDO9437982.1 hypothetical protein [Hydrogenophaga sp.]
MTVHRIRAAQFHLLNRWYAIALSVLIALMVVGCATGPRVVNHSFGFDARVDSPNFEVLAYRYGDGKGVARSSDNSIKNFGQSPQVTAISGPMRLGNDLYVQWRHKTTGQTFEETVDLLPLLPRDMTNKRIYFVVTAAQLYVYLKDLKRHADPKDPIVGPFKLQYFTTRQIYPR